ncbi:F-box/LRR-repeat protein [Trifolium repens]|nr:F-box/LRR-repeat protein [Trifolium repens]
MLGDFDLPDDVWEFILSKLVGETEKDKENLDHHRNHYLETLSLVSKQFFSVTNRLIYSLTIYDQSLPRTFRRFPNLTSLDLSGFRGHDLNTLLSLIPRYSSLSHLTSLNLSNHPTFPTSGLQTIVKRTKLTLTSLICSNLGSLNHTDILFMADSFPSLQQLNINFPKCITAFGSSDDYNNALQVLTQRLPKLRKVNLSGNLYINDSLLFQLCRNCEFLQDLIMFNCPFITHAGIASAICQRPGLISISINNIKEARENKYLTSNFIDSLLSLKRLTHLDLSFSCITDHLLFSLANQALPLRNLVLQGCCKYTYTGISYFLSKSRFLQHLDFQNADFLNDQLFSDLCVFLGDLVSINVSGCHALTNSALFAILRNSPLVTEIKMESTKIGIGSIRSVDLVVYHQVKSLHLAYNSELEDEDINMFAFMFPNMQLLDLSSCCGISKVKVLKTCPKIRHLKLSLCPQANLFLINFEAPKLEVLDLSHSRINRCSSIVCDLKQFPSASTTRPGTLL